jgi:hypothetical protein
LVQVRPIEVWRSADYRWRELFDTADVMSEGAVRQEVEGPRYYGTTSLLLPFASKGGLVPDEQGADVARLVTRDVHARLRATRVSCREARVRSVHPIGRIRVELVVRSDARGIRIDIDVDALVLVTGGATGARRRQARAR